MAKCTNCDYPYATGDKCPNCGSDNPSGGSTLTGILVFVFIVLALAKSCG
jgi:RNA polymerase subunit RPABC4/transcription elongation factor Spt4